MCGNQNIDNTELYISITYYHIHGLHLKLNLNKNRRMKKVLVSLFILISTIFTTLYAQQDTIADKVKINGNIQVTNNGISFVPAFSLGKPAAITMLYITSNRFYYYPEFDFGLNAKPWSIGNRIGYNFIMKGKFNMALGTGLGLYFNRRDSLINNEEFQLQRYTMAELNFGYNFSATRRIQAFIFYSTALDKVGIKSGEMVMLNFIFDRLMLWKGSYLSIVPTVVWLKNTAPFNGVFVSQVTSFHLVRFKPNLSFQTTLPVYTEPHSDFIWNVGLNFPF